MNYQKTIDTLKETHGYKQYPQNYEYPYIYKALLQKRVNSKSVCETNDKLHITIEYSLFDAFENYGRYQIGIRAEKNELWWDLKAYSLSDDEILSRIEEIEKTLIELFNKI